MKLPIKITFLLVLFLGSLSRAQINDGSSCLQPKTLFLQTQCDSIINNIVSEQTEYWISFTANSEHLDFSTEHMSGLGNITSISLFSGDCLSLDSLESNNSYTLGNSVSFLSDFQIGQTYFIKLNVISTTLLAFKVCIKPKSLDSGIFHFTNQDGVTFNCSWTDANYNVLSVGDSVLGQLYNCLPTFCITDTVCVTLTTISDGNVVFPDDFDFVYAFGNQFSSITYNNDNTEVCITFNQTGITTVYADAGYDGVTNPYNNNYQYVGGQVGQWVWTGDCVSYMDINIVDQTPPASISSNGIICIDDLYEIEAYDGSIITSVVVDGGTTFFPNSDYWSAPFSTTGEHYIEYTVDGYCYPVTYFDTVLVIKNDTLTVVNSSCNQLAFTFATCTTYPMISLNFNNGDNVVLTFFSGDTTLFFDFSGINSPISWSFQGLQQAVGFPAGTLEVAYEQNGLISPISPQPIDISGPVSLCELGAGQLNINGNYTNINWTITPSTTISGQGSTSITLGNVDTGSDLLVSVIATDINHCIFADTVIIESCCVPDTNSTAFFERTYTQNGINSIQLQLPNGYYNGPTQQIIINLPLPQSTNSAISTSYSNSTSITQFLADNPTIVVAGNIIQTNNWIFLNNDLIIDQSVTFQNCNFIRIAPGARIIVEPNATLTSNQSTFAPKCNEMWGGFLTSSPEALIWFNDVNIVSAEYGIESNLGGEYRVNNCRFIDNLYGIYIHNAPNGNSSTVFNSYFGDVIGQYLLAPYQTEPQPLAGIWIQDVGGNIIGDNVQPGNLFHNMKKGIYSIRSTIRSYKNNFHNIKHASGLPSPNEGDNYCAIYAANSTSILGQLNYTLYVNENGLNNRNNFVNCEFGVSARNGMNLEAHGNYMKKCILRGISAEDNRFKTLNINANEVNSSSPNAWGIYLKNYNLGTANVTYNQINLNNTVSGITRFSAGIYTSSISPVVNQTTLIKGNTINNCLYGIWMINTTNGTIDLNAININLTNLQINILAATVAPVRGIVVQNSHKAVVTNNQITKPNGNVISVPNQNLQGIRLEVSPASVVRNNTMTKTAVGFYALGSSLGSHVDCNKMISTRNGFFLDQADLSNQGAPVGDPDWPDGYGSDNQWIGTIGARTEGTQTPTMNYYHRPGSNYESIPSAFYSTYWFDNTLQAGSNPIVSFCAQAIPPQIPIESPPVKRKRELFPIATNSVFYDFSDYQHKHYLNLSAYSRLISDSSELFLNEPDDSIYIEYLDSLDLNNSQTKIVYQTQYALAIQDIIGAQNLANTIANTCQQYNTNRQVMEVYIDRMMNEQKLNSEDTIYLREIACLDPIAFGSGVYQARAILDFDGLCQTGLSKTIDVSNLNSNIRQNSLWIYPNPSNGLFTIESDLEMTDCVLIDMSGKELFFYELGNTNFSLETNLGSGIYFLKVKFVDGSAETNKISIE